MSRGFRRDLSMQPRGAPVLRVRVEGLMLPIHMTWGLPVRKFMITAESQVSEFVDKFGGRNGIECRTIANEQQSHICVPLVQIREESVEG